MGNFSPNTKSRAFIAVVQIKNMVNAGLTEEQYMNYEYLADYFTSLWNNSGKGRTSAIAVCESAEGLYHAHMCLYGNTTTLKKVADILFGSHVEPQLGGKKSLSAYLLKEGKYAEKGEKVLYVKNLESIQDNQGSRSDLEMIEELLIKGYTPQEILDHSFRFYKFEKMILRAYIDKLIKDTPIRKDLICEYHVGASGTGKTFYYNQLCETEGADNIYLLTDYDNGASGGLDDYLKNGAPPILFMDEFKGQGISYGKLLTMLSEYSRMQTHSRYSNTYNLWVRCIITTIYPPEELYNIMVPENQQKSDSFKQLLRRLTKIVYHYKDENDYKTYSVNGNDYTDFDTLKQMAYEENGNNGFVNIINEQTDCPFDT